MAAINPVIVPADPGPHAITDARYNDAITVIQLRRAAPPANQAQRNELIQALEDVRQREQHQALIDNRALMIQLHAAMAVALNLQVAGAGAPAPVAPLAVPAAAANNITIKQPEGFDGTRSDARRFIESMELYLGEAQVAPSFPDGQSQIRLALL